MTELQLGGNQPGALPEDILEGLRDLEILGIDALKLTTVPSGLLENQQKLKTL